MRRLTTFSLLRKIASRLKYIQVIDLLGREVIVLSPSSAQTDVQEQLADALPENIDSGRKDPKWIGVTIAKYGLMDLEYGLSGDNLDWATRTYTEDLRKILEIDDPIEHVDELLEILLEDIEETPITLRLYLSTDRCWRANLHYIQKGLPNNYWPLTFIVQDARITNSSLIWSHHHFYL